LYDSLLKRWGYIYATSGVIGLMREWITGGFPLNDDIVRGELTARAYGRPVITAQEYN